MPECSAMLITDTSKPLSRRLEPPAETAASAWKPISSDPTKWLKIGSGAKRPLKMACYLVIPNADPTKEIVSLGHTCFAIQTRRQELSDEETEAQRRIAIRSELRMHNSLLVSAAKDAGVIEPKDYAIFQNHGYMGLYAGLGAQQIHRRKGLRKGQQILDHMGSTELAANLFRATQAEEKLRREKSRAGPTPMKPTAKSERRSVRPSRNWAGPCRSICRPLGVLSNWSLRPERR